ncbi:MAG: hypothetical protein KDB47_06980 [Mycobacterium sp.]|nr:hypothetical protein [Mycobacterium sp.]
MPATKQELSAAMRRIYDALAFMRGPDGEVIFVGEKALQIAWHLARAGADIDPGRAVIKRRPIPARPGQLAGMVDWVPADAPDSDLPDDTTAVGPIPDLDSLYDALPWHVTTKIEGAFQ